MDPRERLLAAGVREETVAKLETAAASQYTPTMELTEIIQEVIDEAREALADAIGWVLTAARRGVTQ